MKSKSIILAIGTLVFLSACSPFSPDELEPKLPQMPQSFELYQAGEKKNIVWWKEFNDPKLNQLMDQALSVGFSFTQAKARLKQAQFSAVKSGALQWPKASLSASQSNAVTGGTDKDSVSTNGYSTGLSLSYDFDIWGSASANDRYFLLQYKATGEDLNLAVQTIAGQVVETYARLTSNKKELLLLNEQLTVYETLLKSIQNRVVQGEASIADIYQQQVSILTLQQSITSLEAQQKKYLQQLALLMGKSPGAFTTWENVEFPVLSKTPSTGLPADLIADRPDVRAAGLRLHSSNWQIAAAKADRLPSLSLSASYTYSSQERSTLFDNWATNLAANLTGPIFDAGYRKAEVERVKAVADERLSIYKETVMTAIKEVEEAMLNEQSYQSDLSVLEQQIELSNKIFSEIQNKYFNGDSDFTNVLNQELSLLSYQRSQIQTQANQMIARATLYRALGIQWKNKGEKK